MTARTTLYQRYDPGENIIFITFPRVHLETEAEIREHFDRVFAFWVAHCKGRRAYYVVNYDGITVNLRSSGSAYPDSIKRLAESCAVTFVRYGGDGALRAAVRMWNMKVHVPSRVYESREDAMAVVRALRTGKMQIVESESDERP